MKVAVNGEKKHDGGWEKTSDDDTTVEVTETEAEASEVQIRVVEDELDWSFMEEGHLYGRQAEVQALQEAFRRRMSKHKGQAELILVSGRSGEGKTVLVRSALEDAVAKDCNGCFLLGKFDQLQTSEPFGPVVDVLNQWTEHFETKMFGNGDVDDTRQELPSKVGNEGCRVLCALAPSLGRVLGPLNLSGTPSASTHDAQADRLKRALTQFFRHVASREHPVVLVFDDLQWASQSCLDVLETLASDSTMEGLVVVGICRSEEVPPHHEFAETLRRLEDEKHTKIFHVQVPGLTLQATNELLEEILDSPAHQFQSFATTLHEASGGNPFYLLQLLKTLHQEGVLVKVVAASLQAEEWNWREEMWQESFRDLNVVGLVACQILRLPDSCKTLLKTAACMGADMDINTVATALGESADKVAELLSIAAEEQMVVHHKQGHGRFSFRHDRVQQAAISLIPVDERSQAHLLIGRSLLNGLSSEDLDKNLFLVVNQLIRGKDLLDNEVDRTGLAELCVRAGRKASQACDFAVALLFFDDGASLLGPRHWRDEYQLSLELFCSRAEAECCCADFDAMDCTVEQVLANCRTTRDKMRPYLTQIYSLGVRSKFQEAIDLGLVVMAGLGERFPSKPRLIYLIPEFVKLKRRLKSKTDDDIYNLPLVDIDDREKLTAMSILSLLQTYVFCADPDWFPFIILRWVQLSLKYGLCDFSCLAFASYGVLLCAVDDFAGAYRYAQLGLRLLKRCEVSRTQLLPRVYFTIFGMVVPWTEPLRSTFEHQPWVVSTAVETGDFECAMFSSYTFVNNCYGAGDSLGSVQARVDQYLDIVLNRCQQGPWLALTLLLRQAMGNLMGLSEDPLALTMKMKATANNKNDFQLYYCSAMTYKLQLSYHFGNLDVALASAKASRLVEKVIKGAFYATNQYFYDGMTALEAARYGKKRQHSWWARKIIKRFQKLSEHSPENFCHKLYLLRGEWEALKGDIAKAMNWYDKAMEEAEQQRVTHLHGLAFERAAVAYQRLGNDDNKAAFLLKQAIEKYEKWGASALVAYIKAKHGVR